MWTLSKVPSYPTSCRTLGYTITALGSLQWVTAVLRPGQDAQLHQAWSTWHKTLGKGALALAFVNISIGLVIGQAPIPYYIWQALVVIGLFMVVSNCLAASLHP